MEVKLKSSRSRIKPRACMVSQRRIRKMAAWCSLYEFEDTISSVDEVERLDFVAAAAFAWREKVVSSLVWRQIAKPFAHFNPGLKPISIDSEYDIFFFGCINPWELLYLNAVKGWKEKCKVKICYMYEMWGGIVPRYEHLLSLLNDFDYVFLGWESSLQPVRKVVSAPCAHVSPAADTLRFSPFPDPPSRSIDVFSMGRRLEPMHLKLLELARKKEIFYIYDTIPGKCLLPSDHLQHRELFANLGKRSRFFITYPAKVDRSDETQGISEPGTRFYEGIATGAVLVGQAPESDTFKREFNWPKATISIGDRLEDFLDVQSHFHRFPEEYNLISRTNAAQALLRHDWVHRWKQILNQAAIESTSKLEARISELARIAAGANPQS